MGTGRSLSGGDQHSVIDESVLFRTVGSTGGSGGCFLGAEVKVETIVNKVKEKESLYCKCHKQLC